MKRARFHHARADRAALALECYKSALGEAGPIDRDTVRDLLQDMLHWLAREGDRRPRATLRGACQTACNDLAAELLEIEPLRYRPDRQERTRRSRKRAATCRECARGQHTRPPREACDCPCHAGQPVVKQGGKS